MNSLNILTNDSTIFQFPTIFEYSFALTYSKHQNQRGQYFSKNKVLINNGDTFNGKYLIKYFKETNNINETIDINDNSDNISEITLSNKEENNFYSTEKHQTTNQTQNNSSITEHINIMKCIGLFTKKQYQEFLDEPLNATKTSYLRNKCNQFAMFFKPNLMPLEQPTTKIKKIVHDDANLKIITSLSKEPFRKSQEYLRHCEVIEQNEMESKLMQCGVIIFDTTNDLEIELEQARFAFSCVYNELINYSDEEIIRSKENGIIRKFILISTAMTWVKEIGNDQMYSENEEVHASVTQKDVLERLPLTKYQIIFEFEKLLLKCNTSKIKDIFKTYVIGTGIIYGHEENALRYIFTNAWHNPKEMYIAMLNRTVPVFHVDELAKLVFILSKKGDRVKNNYILAIEQESYGFNNIIKSMCNELCNSNLVLKEDHFIMNQYKLNSFTWDLICSDLNIDPMLDIIVPDFRVLQTSIVSNMKELTREFVEANNLNSLKVIVSGKPTNVSSNIAEQLAEYYQIQYINIPNLINNCFTLLKNNQIELELKMKDVCKKRNSIKHVLAQLTAQFDEWLEHNINEQLSTDMYYSSNEQNNNEIIVDANIEIMNNYDTYVSENENFTDLSEISLNLNSFNYNHYFHDHCNYKLFTKNKINLIENDTEINNIKYMIEQLNAKYEEYEKNVSRNQGWLDDCYLLPLIKDSLSSFSCRNQGYVLDIFPLSVERMEFIFNNDIGYPNALILLSCNQSITDIQKYEENSTVTNESESLNCDYLEQNTETRFKSMECQSSDIYRGQDVSFNNATTKTNIYYDIRDVSENETESIHMNNNRNYEQTSINDMANYSTTKGIDVRRLNVPLELADETKFNNLQYKIFADAIITLVGDISCKDTRYDTTINESQLTPKLNSSKTIEMNRKLQITSNKLNIMKEQWKKDVTKTLEWEQKQEYRKSVKIHNFLRTNILPKLLKEISPIDNGVSQFPEKTLNKTKLCHTQSDENLITSVINDSYKILITKSI